MTFYATICDIYPLFMILAYRKLGSDLLIQYYNIYEIHPSLKFAMKCTKMKVGQMTPWFIVLKPLIWKFVCLSDINTGLFKMIFQSISTMILHISYNFVIYV